MKPAAVPTGAKGPWATFRLEDEVFAVSSEDIQEVIMQQPLTPVPLAPPHIVGLLNLRGQIMPAIDLRKRLQFKPREAADSPVFLVLKTAESLVSVVVDAIGDVLELPQGAWESVPETLAKGHRAFVFGIYAKGQKAVLGLRVEALVEDVDTGTERLTRTPGA